MEFKKSLGQVSRLLLVLAVVVFVAVVITYLILRMTEKPPAPTVTTNQPTVPLPVYEKTLGNIRFVFESAIDDGNTLQASAVVNPQYNNSNQSNLTTTEKFITVTIGAQNNGTVNTDQNAWDIENIVDSQGRNFVPLQSYVSAPWLPVVNNCGALLKPAFDPLPCTKIYEVSKESTGLKIRVETGVDNTANNFQSGKINSFLLDLIVK